ncbi:hypothetical protein AMEX_G2659 [Astyanax mexicanus]|uniref:Uncharacterized protein n=1 Tax=Astyanax mexicanus TaxID=7994 RepID=A0A8T2MHS9_ASTMX|nr:hypothetical protein AMEX_G2659 [Astyanax mexicanus]
MPSSEKGDLKDPGLYQKEGYLTVSGKIVSLTTSRQVQIDGCIPVRDIVLEENGGMEGIIVDEGRYNWMREGIIVDEGRYNCG